MRLIKQPRLAQESSTYFRPMKIMWVFHR